MGQNLFKPPNQPPNAGVPDNRSYTGTPDQRRAQGTYGRIQPGKSLFGGGPVVGGMRNFVPPSAQAPAAPQQPAPQPAQRSAADQIRDRFAAKNQQSGQPVGGGNWQSRLAEQTRLGHEAQMQRQRGVPRPPAWQDSAQKSPEQIAYEQQNGGEGRATTGQEVFQPGGDFYDPNGAYGTAVRRTIMNNPDMKFNSDQRQQAMQRFGTQMRPPRPMNGPEQFNNRGRPVASRANLGRNQMNTWRQQQWGGMRGNPGQLNAPMQKAQGLMQGY